MKNLFTTVLALIFALTLFAQEQAIEFTYDAAGNLTGRHVIILKKPIAAIALQTKAQGQKPRFSPKQWANKK